MHLNPDQKIKCLFVQPKFSMKSFWNYIDACETIGAKTPSPPLGLITVAAILPQHWEFRLLDLNTRAFSEGDWSWADMVCVGGMLPQQRGILETIDRARRDGKFVAVGGSDPSSQPDLYAHADALIVGEGEDVIPRWLESWRNGQPRGVFREKEKPDVTKSPVPRYDLLDFSKYVQVGVQYSRGCPFNCEFCDIIELFGRKPRTKEPWQIGAELSRIKQLGYSGSVDLVDDNFIGNIRNVKRYLLPALIEWNRVNGYPFYYSTEASMNLGDDAKLLELMREAEFRVIFMGIESPDPEVLMKTQKTQNAVRPIYERISRILEYGMVPTGGFIMGFDGEKKGADLVMIKLIEDCYINLAMVGLLVALPNTQLTRRLLREKRLLSFKGELITDAADLMKSARSEGSIAEVVDQTVAGLNFIPTRNRNEIYEEYRNVVRTVYEPRRYFDRVLRMAARLGTKSKHRPRWFELRRTIVGFFRLSFAMSRDPEVRWLYWRNFLKLIPRGHVITEQAMRVMGIYLHFKKQSRFVDHAISELMSKNRLQEADLQCVKADQVSASPPGDGREVS